MAKESLKSLASGLSPDFQPYTDYSEEADCLEVFLAGDEYCAHRVDEIMTLYLTMETDDLVGCQIKSVRRLLEKAGGILGLSILEGGEVKLSAILGSYRMMLPRRRPGADEERRATEYYERLLKHAQETDARVNLAGAA